MNLLEDALRGVSVRRRIAPSPVNSVETATGDVVRTVVLTVESDVDEYATTVSVCRGSRHSGRRCTHHPHPAVNSALTFPSTGDRTNV